MVERLYCQSSSSVSVQDLLILIQSSLYTNIIIEMILVFARFLSKERRVILMEIFNEQEFELAKYS